MKKILILLTIMLGTFTFSQELKFEEVVKVDSTISKDELYNRARSWLSKSFKSEKDVMLIEDRNNGEVTGNGTIRYVPEIFYFGSTCARGYISYKVNIYVKEGRYKYDIHTFTHEGTPCSNGGGLVSYGLITSAKKSDNGPKAGWNEIKDLINSKMPKVIEFLKDGMSKKYEGSEEW